MGMYNWLNEPVIKAELHVNASKHWANCNGEVSSRYQKNPEQSYPLYKQLIKEKLRIWVVSGDHDADVPITGTLTWLEQLREEANLAVEYPWNEWWIKGVHKFEDQVAGMTWGLRGLKFVSIRAAGHMAHRDQRQASWVMIDSFMKGNELPAKDLF
jgi:serine carboxypeptidase-like clade 2